MPLNEKILLTDIIFTFHCFTIFADSTLSSSNRMKNPITAFTLYKVAHFKYYLTDTECLTSHFLNTRNQFHDPPTEKKQ